MNPGQAKSIFGRAALAVALPAGIYGQSMSAAALQQFEHQVDDYISVRKMVASQLPKQKSTASAPELAERKKQFAASLAEARAGAAQGTMFTPEIAAEFRRLAKQAMDGKNGVRVKSSLKHSEPVNLAVRVNQPYPPAAPLQSMPPTLLAGLPKLPMELEYRLVGRTLVLRDVESNLIVDFLPEAIP